MAAAIAQTIESPHTTLGLISHQSSYKPFTHLSSVRCVLQSRLTQTYPPEKKKRSTSHSIIFTRRGDIISLVHT